MTNYSKKLIIKTNIRKKEKMKKAIEFCYNLKILEWVKKANLILG